MEAAAVLSLLVFLMVSQAVWLAAPVEASAAAERVATYVIPIWEPRPEEGIGSITRRHRDSRLPWLEALLERFNIAAGLSLALLKAGVPLRPGEFVFVQLLSGLLFAGAGLVALRPTLGGTV